MGTWPARVPRVSRHTQQQGTDSRPHKGAAKLTRRRLCAHANAQQQAAAHQLDPGVAKGTGQHGPQAKVGGDENGAAAAPVLVDGVREPAAAQGGANVGRRVDEADEHLVLDAVGGDAKGPGEVEVGAVGARLVPALDGGAERARGNGQVEAAGDAPLVQHLVAQRLDFLVAEGVVPGNVLVARGVLGDEGPLAHDAAVLVEAVGAAKGVDVGEQDAARDADEGVLDPGAVISTRRPGQTEEARERRRDGRTLPRRWR